MRYKEIFEDSWHELVEKARKKEFTPNQEQDIVCMLYHLCLLRLEDPNLIHASSAWNFDIVLGDVKGEKRKNQKFAHCLLAELKFILRKARKSKRLKAAGDDVQKLSEEGDSTTTRIFAIFDKAECMEQREITELSQYANTKNITVYYGCPYETQ